MSHRTAEINRTRLRTLVDQQRAQYAALHPGSQALAAHSNHLFGGVPMTWMNKWSGGFPLSFASARGATVVDVDGHSYIDFALGDTGAMAGHSPQATVDAITERISTHGGITTMLTTEDGEWVGAELARRFSMSKWSFTLTATDANRFALRIARAVTGRSKILCFSYSYHGSVDETFIVVDNNGAARSRPGNVAPAVDPTVTSKVVEFNDAEALADALSARDVAVVICEPAMTNIGIVLPDAGFHDTLRRLCTETGTLLLIDETHTFSLGEGGATKAWGLSPDIVTIGKAIAGGIPSGAYGLSRAVAEAMLAKAESGLDIVDVGGVGGTLAGNALSLAATRATLDKVLTAEAFAKMESLAIAFTDGVEASLDAYDAPFCVTRLGCRAEYRFCYPAPRNGGEAAAADDSYLNDYFHLYLANRGILITPFHNMALMCPATTLDDVDAHRVVFDEALGALFAP